MENDKQNIKVAVRIRPFSPQELQEKHQPFLEVQNSKSLAVANKQLQKHVFNFDFVGNEFTNQEQIFEQLGKSLCLSCLQGYNGCIFAYGQTGAGKTYTITGDDNQADQGLLPRSLEYLYQQIHQYQRKPNLQYKIKCSYLEVYNETILDLLNPQSGQLATREDTTKENLKQCQVNNVYEAQKYFRIGNENRHVAETNMNLERYFYELVLDPIRYLPLSSNPSTRIEELPKSANLSSILQTWQVQRDMGTKKTY